MLLHVAAFCVCGSSETHVKELCVLSWCVLQIALTTLEEVFLNIAKQAEIENAQGKNIVVQAEVDGHMLPVSVGQELVTDPATNKSYKLFWGQDHNGELCVSEVIPLPG